MELADVRHRIEDREEDRMNPFKVFLTPVSCGELMARRPPRHAASGL